MPTIVGVNTINIVNADAFDRWQSSEALPALPTKATFGFQTHFLAPDSEPMLQRLQGRAVITLTLSPAERLAGIDKLLAKYYPATAADILTNSRDLDAARAMFKSGHVVLPVHPRVSIEAAEATTPEQIRLPLSTFSVKKVSTHAVALPSPEKLAEASARKIAPRLAQLDREIRTSRGADEAEHAMSIKSAVITSEAGRLGQLEVARPFFAQYLSLRAELLKVDKRLTDARDNAGAQRVVELIERLDRDAGEVIRQPYNPEMPKWTSALNELRGDLYRAMRATGLSIAEARAAVYCEPVAKNDPLGGINDVTIFE